MKHIKLLTVLLFAVLLMSTTDRKTTTIFIIGDSTAANKDISHDRKERGLGMALQCYFDDNIV
ncbi:MAG: pectin esterase, partial [Prevotella sp.]|nr:pectin esterase [Prevotella sp.]